MASHAPPTAACTSTGAPTRSVRAAYTYIVVGGGVAGTTCAAELAKSVESARTHAHVRAGADEKGAVLLLSASSFVKGVTNYVRLSDALENFDVEERHVSWITEAHACVDTCVDVVTHVRPDAHVIVCASGRTLQYDRLCVCTGAEPRTVLQHPLIIGLRDTHTVQQLADMMRGARRIGVLGNGGIALGLVHELCQHELVWIVKDAFIGTTFFDASASEFFLTSTGLRTRMQIHAPSATAVATRSAAPSDEVVMNWHDDRPLNERGGDASDAEDAREVIPTYAPLPPRAGRKRARKTAPSALKGAPASTGTADAVAPMQMQGADTCHAPFGSCLGPGWINVLQHVSGSAVPIARDTPDAAPRVHLHLDTELRAVRGSGAGACGALASGEWLDLDGLGAGAPSCSARSADAWPLYMRLSSGAEVGCDFLVSATGVRPRCPFLPTQTLLSNQYEQLRAWACTSTYAEVSFAPAAAASTTSEPAAALCFAHEDGGLLVNRFMQTTCSADVFAAGDCASVLWPLWMPRDDPAAVCTWFQMRLWAQARAQAVHAARCMSNELEEREDEDGGIPFELFAHMTRFLGFKVVLLGIYNGQGLDAAYAHAIARNFRCTSAGMECTAAQTTELAEDAVTAGSRLARDVQVLYRVTPGVEYIKIVVKGGRVVGALLIGDTDLEETMENLILNRLSILQPTGELLDILNPDIDAEDFFD